ncbi:MAG TPA: IPT/TIG domain-containing protein [Sandaracinaceae bacterium]
MSPNPRATPAVRAEQPLTCRLDSPRAPLNGIVTIFGTGFAPNALVQIGGSTAPIVSRRQDALQVRVPGNGGMVRVVQGNQSANCGTLSIAGR